MLLQISDILQMFDICFKKKGIFMITLVPCTLSHVSLLVKIGREIFEDTFAEQNNPEDLQTYLNHAFSIEKIENEISNPESEFYLAQMEEETVGYLKINWGLAQNELNLENSLEIERIYLKKTFWGKNISPILLNKAFERAEELKVDFVWLGVWEHNPRAIRFYEKQGFEKFDTHIYMIGEDAQTDWLMRKHTYSIQKNRFTVE